MIGRSGVDAIPVAEAERFQLVQRLRPEQNLGGAVRHAAALNTEGAHRTEHWALAKDCDALIFDERAANAEKSYFGFGNQFRKDLTSFRAPMLAIEANSDGTPGRDLGHKGFKVGLISFFEALPF